MILALTGGTGFVGQAVLDEAARRGVAVRALARKPQGARAGVEWVQGDLADEAALGTLVTGADAVLHIAGVTNAPDLAGFLAANFAGTEAVIEAARAAGVARFIHVSSLAVREPGLSDYGRSKLLGEEAARTSGLDWMVVRPPAVYGPRDREAFELFRLARRGFLPMPRAGRASYIHVDDLARLLLALLPKDTASERIFEPDDGKPGGWDHEEFAAALGRAVGCKVRVLRVPAWALRLGARIDRLVRGKGAHLTLDRVGYMVHPDWVANPARKPPAELWTPLIPTPDGLAATAQWYRSQGWL